MVDQVTGISAKLGKGGRLYRDARERDNADTEPTPEPKIETHAPQIPQPWAVTPLQPETTPKKRAINWQQTAATLLQVLGMTAISGACAMVYPWLGVLVAGICLIVLGVALGLPTNTTPAVPGKHKR